MLQDHSATAPESTDVAIIGGGLAGLCAAIHLARAGRQVTLLEKRDYPTHRVCGEYVSREVVPYLQSLGFDPYKHGAAHISRLALTTPSGAPLYTPLKMGGFGLSRWTMDAALADVARHAGVDVRTRTPVENIAQLADGSLSLTLKGGKALHARFAAGAWGKRDALDRRLERPFMQARTGFMGVKYHVRGQWPADQIALHLFPGGYCGHSRVEGSDVYNLCYLFRRGTTDFRDINDLQKRALFRNQHLHQIFREAEFVLDAPEVINEISFAPKAPVMNGVLLCGDSAGLITPLCGNGMAMAIRGARIAATAILAAGVQPTQQARQAMEVGYARAWRAAFGQRLWWGRAIQRMFYSDALLGAGLGVLRAAPWMRPWLIGKTHGAMM